MSQARNYSFERKNPDQFDQIEVDGQLLPIPARIGSCFWAVLRTCYANANREIQAGQLLKGVAAAMLNRDPASWEDYCRKPNTRPWEERVLMCAMMLVRRTGNNPYGLRLAERGHSLDSLHGPDGTACFILRTASPRASESGPTMR